jgi:TRAP-type mannitol/chloroaromatic compound transport system substrate-binding protein
MSSKSDAALQSLKMKLLRRKLDKHADVLEKHAAKHPAFQAAVEQLEARFRK